MTATSRRLAAGLIVLSALSCARGPAETARTAVTRLAEARRAVDQARALGPALPEVAVATSFLSGVGQAAAPSAPTGRPGGLRPRPGMIGQ